MRLAVVLAILMSAIACEDADAVSAAAGIHTNECSLFEVIVHLQVDRSITSRVITAGLRDETERLWKPYGVRVAWADARAAGLVAHRFSLEAILAPRIEELDLPEWPTVLGRVAVEPDGPSARPIRMSFDATEKVLELRTTNQPLIARDHELARALGRVLAHEMGHVLLGAPFHVEEGLMRAVFRSDELAGPNRAPFRLTRTDVGRLRSRIPALTGIEPEAIERQTCIPGRTGRSGAGDDERGPSKVRAQRTRMDPQ